MARRRWLVGGAALVLAVGGVTGAVTRPWSDSNAVFDGQVTPSDLGLTAPAYAAATPQGLLVRSGERSQVVASSAASWLPDGMVLLTPQGGRQGLVLIDAATGARGPEVPIDFEAPSRSVVQVNVLDPSPRAPFVTAYSPDLERRWRFVLPQTPADNDYDPQYEVERNYFGAAPTVGDVTFLQWADSVGDFDDVDTDYGLLRIEGDPAEGEVEAVLVNERIVGLYLSADGGALMALRQTRGEPCGGCVVEQDIVEIDPATGRLAGEYGVPDGYGEAWRVSAMDKVGDRVAVRYEKRSSRAGADRPLGTFVYDGEWSKVPGSSTELTWWQGPDDLVVARVDGTEAGNDLDGYDLFWLHDGVEEALRGELEASYTGARPRDSRYFVGSVSGQLLPPG
ncbi:MAG: hypothetical protein WKF79_01375 [Nocardioides sp.]